MNEQPDRAAPATLARPSSASSASSAWASRCGSGLWVTPPDVVQGNLARLLYIHPAVATVALYWAGGVAAGGSLLYLWPRTRSFFWDRLAAAAVEVGAVFSALTLVTGSLWGRPVWGVWWTWDARLTSTALLLLLEIGYLALRRVPADPDVRARRCAVAALLVAIDVPIVHFSVDWWNTLHQGGTILDPGFDLHVHGSMLVDDACSASSPSRWSSCGCWRALPDRGAPGRGGRPGARGLAGRALERGRRARRRRERRRRRRPGGERAVSYVDAGYAAALGALFVYAVSLVLRRRRWERALRMAEPRRRAPTGAPVDGERS